MRIDDPSGDGDAVKLAQEAAAAEAPAETEEAAPKSGAELAEDAVALAQGQTDRSERWQDFAKVDAAAEIPVSVEEQAREQADRQSRTEADSERVRVQDLLNQITIQGGKIGA